MHRVTLPRALAALVAGLLLAVGLQAPSDAAISRTVSLATSATSGLTKTAMKFSGKVSKSPKGTTVTIQRKAGTRWVSVKSTRTTTTAGNYSLVLTLPGTVGTYSFRTYAPGTRRLRAAASVTRRVKVMRKTVVTATADPMTVAAGGTTTMTGTVAPYVVNTLVSVQKLLSGRWTNIATAPVTSGGKYTVSFPVGPTTDFRVASPLTGYNAVGYSPTRRVITTPVIATSTLATGTRTLPYSAKVVTVGGEPGFWSATGLPNGLSMNGSTGVISGTPTQNITSTITVSYQRTVDSLIAPTKQLTLSVNQAPAPVITTKDTDVPDGTQVEPYTASLAATGPGTTGTPAGTWQVDNLPDGLSVAPSTGKITGAPEEFGTFTLVLGFTQASTGLAAQQVSFPITITQAGPPTITTSAVPSGKRTNAYTPFSLEAKGPPNGAVVSGSWSSTALPAGLALNASTGVISGTPTAVENKTVTFTFTQAITGRQATKQLGITVVEADAPVISTTSLSGGTVGTPYTSPDLAANGSPAGTWDASPLPSGVNLSAAGVFSGTPTAAGTTNVVIEFTQTSTGLTATKTLALAIKPVVSTSSLAPGVAGTAYSVTLAAAGGNGGTWTATPRPAGISIDASTGVLSGTPTTAGSTNVVITYSLNGQTSASKTLALVVKPNVTTSSLPQGTAGAAYPGVTLAQAGGTGGDWTASPLPAGLTLDDQAGTITGTPTTAGSTNVVITYTVNGQTSAGKTLALVVKPAVSTSSLPQGTVGSAYSTTLAATGGNGGTWTASPLPAGLSLDEDTGAITGTPTAAGSTSVVTSYTVNGQTASRTLTLNVRPVVSTSTLAQGVAGSAYSVTLAASGGSGGTWAASPRPAGIAIDTSTGVLSGTPTTAGSTNVVITYTVNGQTSANKTLALVVKPNVTTASLANGTVGSAYSVTLAATGGNGGTWTASPLPAGLSLDSDTGAITGSPTAAGTTNVVITYAVNGQTSATKTLSLDVKPVITTASLTTGTVGTSYSLTLAASGGSGGTWTASPLPAGLSLDASTGAITGTPTTAGSTNVVIGYSRGGVAADGKTISLAVRPAISTTSLPAGTRTEPYSFTLDGTGTGTWSASPLPAGLSLNTATGAITGTPTTVGTTNVVIGYTVNGQSAATKTLTLVINQADPPVITTSTLPDGTQDSAYSGVVQAQGNPTGTWSTEDPLPAGLTIDENDGTISGTPTVAGNFTVVVRFTQTSTGLSTTKSFSLHIDPAV